MTHKIKIMTKLLLGIIRKTEHTLKVWPPYFEEISKGIKAFDVRKKYKPEL